MAVNFNAVKKLNEAKRQRQAQLAQAYEDLGGSNPAYKPIQQNNVLARPQRMNATIPQLEKAVVNAFEGNNVNEIGKGTSEPHNIRQTVDERSGGGGHHSFGSATPGANLTELASAKTDSLNSLNHVDYSGARQQYAPLYNDILNRQLEDKFRRIGINSVADLPEIITQPTIMGQGNNAYGKPTPEMQALGITQEDIQRYLDPIHLAEGEAKTQAFAESHPVLATGAAIVANPITGAIGDLQQVSDRIQGKPLTQSYDPASIIRDTVSGNIDSNLGRIVYGGVNSIGDMGMALLLGKAFGGTNNQAVSRIAAGIMGSEKANDTMNSAIERGLTPNQVLAEGVGSGAATYLSEVALGPLERIAGGSGNILRSMASEGLQEGLEDIVDTLFDQAITISGGNVEKSEFGRSYQAYLDMGLSEEEAKKQVLADYWDQLKLDSALGAITGGLMQGGSNVISGRNAVTGNLTQRNQNQILESLNADEVSPDNYNTFSQAVDSLKEQVPEMSKRLDSLRNDVSNQIVSDVKEAAETVLESLDINAYNDFVQNAEQIKVQIPSLASDIDNILADTTNELTVLASESLRADVKRNVDNVIPRVDNVNADTPVNTQPVQNEIPILPREPRASRADVSAAINTANGIRENLGLFKERNARTLEARIDKAIQNVRNTTGQAQIDAIQELNNTVNGVRSAMQYSTIGINERGLNADGFERMHNVTDGRRIKVTPAMLNDLNISLTQLNNMTNTGTNNRIRFYAADNPNAVSLDSVWNEMVDLSGNELPMVSEGDQLQALINYINEYKSKKGNEVNTVLFNDLPVTDSRPEVVREWEGKADDLIDRMLEGDYTEEEVQTFLNDIIDAGNKIKKNPEAQQALADLWAAVKYAERVKVEERLNENLPDDIKAIETPEQAQQVLDDEVQKLDRVLAMNLEMFSENEGEIPSLDNRELHTGVYKDSKFSTNSFPNSGIMTDAEMTQKLSDENKQYEVVTHEGTYNKATENLKRNGYTNELKDLMNRKGWDAVDVDEAMLCSMRAVEDARNAEARGVDSKQAWKKAVDLFVKMREEATGAGQAINALKKWSSKTPEGKLGQAIAYAKDSQKSGVDNAWMKELKNVQDSNNTVFTKEFIEEFLKKAHQYDNQTPTIAQEERLNQELAHMVLDQIPKKFKDKFTSLWMDNLLASIRTLFTRNTGGNAGKFALDQTITKALSGPIDELASKLTGTRTTTGFTREGFKTAMSGLREGALNTARDYWAANADPEKIKKFRDIVKEFDLFADANVSNRPGEEGNFRETLKNNRNAFESKAFKLYDKFIKFGLAFSDNPFYTAVYNQTLQELNTLKENGRLKLPENVSDEKFEQWAKSYAYAQALEAVYQNDTALSNGAMRIKQGLGEMSEGYLGVDILSGASMPFVRTPMNVILTNLEYSPLGVVKNAIHTIREISNNLKNDRSAFDLQSFNQSRFVRETSRNLVGMLMFGVGLLMKSAGLLTGGYSDNDKEKQAQKEAGMQEYALVNPFNGNQYSINWIPAAGSNLVSAAAFADAFSKPDQSTLEALASGLKEGSASMFEMAALQGLQRLTGSANYNSDNSIIDNAVQTVANTASSAIVPSFVRQIAAAIDPYKRNTYGSGGYESILNNAINGIPFLRQTLQPRVGSNGQPLEQNAGRNTLQKWMDNLVNPAMVTVPSAINDPVRDEAMRLFGETRNYDAFQPEYDRNYLEVNGFEPTTEDYTEFWSRANSAMNGIASDVIQSEYYQSLSDERKEDMLASIYSLVKQGERAKYLNLDTSNFDSDVMAYLNAGADGLVDYLTARDALNQLGLANNENNRNAVLAALERSGQSSFPDMLSNYQNSFDKAWKELGPVAKRYSEMVSGLSDEEYEALVNDFSSIIRRVEANRAIGYSRDYDGADKAYYNGGVNGLLEYLYPATVLRQSGMENNEKNRQTILDAYTQGGSQAVQQQINQFLVFSDTGYGPNLSYKYNHATNYLPQLTPTEFAGLYDRIDQQNQGESGYNNITQQEVIDFLNQNPSAYNSDTALQYWYAFDGKSGTEDAWKKIPVLNPSTGMWEAQR